MELGEYLRPIFKHFGHGVAMLEVLEEQRESWMDFMARNSFNEHEGLAIEYRRRFMQDGKAPTPRNVLSSFSTFVKGNPRIKEAYKEQQVRTPASCEACHGQGGFRAPVVSMKTGEERECFFACGCDNGKLLYGGFPEHNRATPEMMAWRVEQDRKEDGAARAYVEGLGFKARDNITFHEFWNRLQDRRGPIGQKVT